ncbi:MAG: Glycosylphosphatidylinositol (GPI) anchor assembly protein [Chrysothrix sp. TS-e1954]|nr:MAG: Glycosylphosphatidylinositol (GPI) anchor assembly protein [Chrysothrix sp. TS-e1954]
MAPAKHSTPTTSLSTPALPLSTPTSQTYRHIHTPLLLGIYIASFRSLVSDPVSTGFYLLLPLALLQGIYCAVCLPPHGDPGTTTTTSNSNSTSTSNSTIPPSARRKPNPPHTGSPFSKIIPTLLSLTLASTLPPLPLYALLVCHGAPLTTHLGQNALLALHLALLVTPQIFYVHGMSGEGWCWVVSLGGGVSGSSASASGTGAGAGAGAGASVSSTSATTTNKQKTQNQKYPNAPPEKSGGGGLIIDAVSAQALGTLLGAWLGAIPIPLDWDRAWQAWPVTVLTGAWVGAGVGQVMGGLVAERAWRVGFGA